MTTRTRYTGASTDVPWDDAGATEGFGNQYNRLMGVLFDKSALALTAVGGTGNAVTASLDPVLDGGGLVDGMKFTITWAAANTGGVTLAINGGTALPVLDASAGALASGRLANGLRSLLEYVGGSFRVLTGLAGGLTVPKYYEAFTASGTWTKPTDIADDAMVVVEAWGAGGSGGRASGAGSGGGAGGGYVRRYFRAADLPSSVAVAIGAGGAARTTNGAGNNGGNTTFGSLLTAFGGAGGSSSGSGLAGGGGELAAATAMSVGGRLGGGPFVSVGVTQGGAIVQPDALSIWGGGAGGGTITGADTIIYRSNGGGYAAYGGAGGGMGSTTSADRPGGLSLNGGNGGSGGNAAGSIAAVAGSAPGGGGGGGNGAQDSGAGARGEVRIWIT